jgi:hypothetical protein
VNAEEDGEVEPIIHHHPVRGFSPSVAAKLSNTVNVPLVARYLGSWAGLLTQHPQMLGFEVHEGGKDLLHTVTATDPRRLSSALLSSGIRRFSMTSRAPYRALVFDQGGTLTPILEGISDGRLHSTAGTGHTVGSGQGTPADARGHYRNTIAAVERSVGGDPGER